LLGNFLVSFTDVVRPLWVLTWTTRVGRWLAVGRSRDPTWRVSYDNEASCRKSDLLI